MVLLIARPSPAYRSAWSKKRVEQLGQHFRRQPRPIVDDSELGFAAGRPEVRITI
jgi:hypothetical protein